MRRTLWPITAIVAYLVTTVILFRFGPLEWQPASARILYTFLGTALLSIFAFYALGVSRSASESSPLAWRPILVTGAALSIVMLFPSAYFYADRMPWHLLSALQDQQGAYAGLQAKLSAAHGGREIVALARAITYPLIFAVLPLGILNWRKMTGWLWLLFGLSILSTVAFSILRGTDREVFDLLFIASASLLVLAARERFLSIKRLVAIFVVGAIVAVAAFGIFSERRIQRSQLTNDRFTALLEDKSPHGGWMTIMCVRYTCADPDNLAIKHLSAPAKYSVVMLTNYLTNGYKGLSIALTDPREFSSTLGIGHSPAIKRLYEKLTGDIQLYRNGYTYRFKNEGWSDAGDWSTIFPWLANDVGFAGSILVVGLFAFLFGMSWRDAVWSINDRAAIVFCFLFQLFVYLPANNQLAQTMDGYFAAIAWASWWLLNTKVRMLRPTPATAP